MLLLKQQFGQNYAFKIRLRFLQQCPSGSRLVNFHVLYIAALRPMAKLPSCTQATEPPEIRDLIETYQKAYLLNCTC